MKRTRISLNLDDFPSQFHPLLHSGTIFDSSCSTDARVYFIDRDGGYFLKSAPKGTLKTEADMTAFFHSKGLSAQVLAYESGEKDWLLTSKVPGEDCLHQQYLDDPKRLCDATAEFLRQLHSLPTSGCPVPDRTKTYMETARRNYETGNYDASLFPDNWGYDSPEAAWDVICKNGHLLRSDTLLHGDYCLPIIMMDDWKLSGFIDVGSGGVGDRHVDLFWGMWSLMFNLKTDAYRERFLDCYGREIIEPEMFPIISAFEVFG